MGGERVILRFTGRAVMALQWGVGLRSVHAITLYRNARVWFTMDEKTGALSR
jgi:hypothetical protein